MKIVHVIEMLHPSTGGPAAVVLQLAAAQAQAGHPVSLISQEWFHGIDESRQFIAGIPGTEHLDLRMSVISHGFERLISHKPLAELKREMANADVVHIHGVWNSLPVRAASLARRLGMPYVVTPHGALDPYCLAQKALKKKLFLRLVHRRMLNHAAMLHALNTDEQRLVAPLGLTAQWAVIPNGIDLAQVRPLPVCGLFRATHRERVGDRPYLLFLSRLHHKKGLDVLVEAYAQAVAGGLTLDLVIAGPDGGAEEDLRQRVEKHGLQSRVHLVGPLYGPVKYQALVDAYGFVLPSRQEGFSMAITEAMACGVPVVITENCHFPEVAQAGAGLVVPLDEGALARAIVQLASDPEGPRRMGKAGSALVESRFTWPRIAAQMVQAYQDIGGVRPRPAA